MALRETSVRGKSIDLLIILGFVGRGTNKKIAFIPESSYFKYCEKCMECMDLCPTGVFPSNYGMERIPQISDEK